MKIKKEYTMSNDEVAKIGLFIALPCILIVNMIFIFMWRENL